MFGMGPWELLIIVLPVLVTILVIAFFNKERSQKSDQVPEEKLGGWLILLIILLAFNAIFGAGLVVISIAGRDFVGGIIPLLEIVFIIWLFLEMGKRSRMFPIGIKIFWLFNVFVGLVAAMSYDGLPRGFVISIVWACIWIPYMKYSKRVARTFGIESPIQDGDVQPNGD